MKPFRSLSWLAAVALLAGAASPSRAQTLEADYEFDNTYASSAGTIGNLSVVGDPDALSFTTASVDGVTRSVLDIGASLTSGTSGVQAQTAPGFGISDTNYSIEVTAEFDLEIAGATKVLDFQNLSSDAGLYINDATGIPEFADDETLPPVLDFSALATPAVAGTFINLALTRNAANDLVSVYDAGKLAFSFTDSSGLAVLGDASNTGNAYLTLFQDDGQGVGGSSEDENSEGELASVKIYNGVLSPAQIPASVPEPSTWALFGLGGAILLCGTPWVRRVRE